MMRCPHCGNQEFRVEMTISTIATLTCHDDGDYTETNDDRQNCDWHRVTCGSCQQVVDEDLARDTFDAHQASLTAQGSPGTTEGVIILRGIPGSGKTTWALAFQR